MAYDLRSMSDDEIEAEYHKRLANKSPADAGKSIAASALISTGGAEVTAPNRPEPVSVEDYIAQPRQAKFIGQSGDIRTGPADISQTYQTEDRRGNVTTRSGLIDARAPVKYGGALTGPSLTPEDQWRAQFIPSSDLQVLNERRDTLNAASRVKNPGYDPVADILQLRRDNAIYSTQQQQRITAGAPLAQNTDDNGLGNDPFRKFFGGGLPTPTPTPIPTPPKMVEETPYWRKKKDEEYA